MNLAFRMALGLAGVTDADAAQIDAAIPAIERLIEAEKKLNAIAQKPQPLQAHLDQIIPVLKARDQDAATAIAVIEKLISFIKDKEK